MVRRFLVSALLLVLSLSSQAQDRIVYALPQVVCDSSTRYLEALENEGFKFYADVQYRDGSEVKVWIYPYKKLIPSEEKILTISNRFIQVGDYTIPLMTREDLYLSDIVLNEELRTMRIHFFGIFISYNYSGYTLVDEESIRVELHK